jgi:hypothetical protein
MSVMMNRSVRLRAMSCIYGLATILATALPPALADGVEAARTLAVPNSSLKVALWNEVDRAGVTTPHYAVAFDGVHFSPPQATSYRILVAYQEFDPAAGVPAVPANLAADRGTNVYIVQFYTQPLDAYRAQIEALGGEIGSFIPNNAHVITMSPEVRVQVAALPFVRWVGPYEPAYRVDPQILAELTRNAPDFEPQRYSILVNQRGPAQQQALASRIRALGGEVHFITPEGFRMEATLALPALAELVRADELNYIDPWGGPGELDMNIARSSAGLDADFVQTTLGLGGEGVRGEVFDTGVRATHLAFLSPNILLHTVNSTDTNHGTSTYGEVFGNGASNAQGKGMLPNREQGIFAYYQQVTQFGGSKTRHQHTAELVDPNGPYRGVFQTSSVGSALTTSYTSISSEVDDYLFLYDLLSCQSQSNNGNTSSRPQAWAKNIVSVGGFYHYDNTNRGDDRWNSGASTGPASDTRIKPDLSAFYDSILCTTDTSNTAYTTSFGGTSGATPMTAGSFGLLFQMWHAGVWAGHGGGASVFEDRCHMATAKALMINSAYQYPLAGESGYTDLTRVRQGWGMANLQNLYNQSVHSFVIDEEDLLTPLQTRTYFAQVAAGEAALKATLVYTDPHGNPSVQSQHRINDLSLEVIAPDGTIYWGNHGLSTARWTTPGGSADTKNTVENVFLASPATGLWKVQVIGSEIVQDGHPETPGVTDADYALVVTGVTRRSLGDLNCDGLVDFDDINPFVLALGDPASYQSQYPNCSADLGDVNGDGIVDFDDINPFVALLAG